jgi:hypothetical protein
MINVTSKASSKEGHMIIFTICSDPDQILYSDPALLKGTVP